MHRYSLLAMDGPYTVAFHKDPSEGHGDVPQGQEPRVDKLVG
jgi:hypothetical protein